VSVILRRGPRRATLDAGQSPIVVDVENDRAECWDRIGLLELRQSH
jgi:hypothetical protein